MLKWVHNKHITDGTRLCMSGVVFKLTFYLWGAETTSIQQKRAWCGVPTP
jgi:hypothetical protein